LLLAHGRIERGALWPKPVPAEPGDVVEREAAPERAQGGVAGGAIFREVVEQLVEGLLAQCAAYSDGGSGNRSISSWTTAMRPSTRRRISPALWS
jgi:hypothetical protein